MPGPSPRKKHHQDATGHSLTVWIGEGNYVFIRHPDGASTKQESRADSRMAFSQQIAHSNFSLKKCYQAV